MNRLSAIKNMQRALSAANRRTGILVAQQRLFSAENDTKKKDTKLSFKIAMVAVLLLGGGGGGGLMMSQKK